MPLYNPLAISADLLATTDNTYDIGADGDSRPKSLWLAGNVNADGGVTAGGEVLGATLAAVTNITAGGYVNVSQIAVDVVAASTHTLTVLINNVAYKILLST
jgi:hypothetical protein